MNEQLNTFELSRKWFNYGFDNPEKVKPIHSAIYFFAIEHCNRLGWKQKFGFPSQMVMEAIGVKNWRTYSKGLTDLVDFGFIEMVETSKNQYSSNIIAIVKNTKAPTKALDKALQKHSTKQGQSTVSINKQYNKEQETSDENPITKFTDWFNTRRTQYLEIDSNFKRLSYQDKKNLDQLKELYEHKDFEKVILNMSNDKYCNENKRIIPSHFLEYFENYISIDSIPLISKKQKTIRGWKS